MTQTFANKRLPIWRSMLFVPVNNERFLASAPKRGADVIQLDLEDSIPPDQKAEARGMVRAAAVRLDREGVQVVVRINRPWRQAVADIESSVCAEVMALTLPKVPDASHIRAVGEILDELEFERGLPRGHTGLVAMIETADGLGEMRAIAAAPRVLGITVGAEDLAVSMGMVPDDRSLYVPNVMAVAAALVWRLLGLPPPPAVAFEDAEMTPMARSFYADNKRVSNRRIKEDLGVRLRYPDYRSGLAAILASEGGSPHGLRARPVHDRGHE